MQQTDMEENPYHNKRVTVMGLGLFGGGTDAARFLIGQGADVTVTDLKGEEDLAESLRRLEGLPVTLHLGGHREEDFRNADLVIVNPAVPDESPYLAVAKEAGAGLDYAMNIFFRLCPAPVVGITGSNGKSTTTALVGRLLEKVAERVWVSGNIGGAALLENVEEIQSHHIVVLELSSFQLEKLACLKRSPEAAVVTNISPNHLDRHKTMDNYVRAKKNIIAFQRKCDCCFLNRDDENLRTWADEAPSKVYFFSTREELSEGTFLKDGRIISRIGGRELVLECLERIVLPGRHNTQNILAAAGVANRLGVKKDGAEEVLAGFRGLEHRLEFVGEAAGVKYYNDSIATTPESAIAGLNSFSVPIVLIAGGYDKKVSLDAFADEVTRKAKAAVLIGKTARKIGERIAGSPSGRRTPCYIAESLQEAVARAKELAESGDVVLLSPACASYDMFRNFVERGRRFKELVGKLNRLKAQD